MCACMCVATEVNSPEHRNRQMDPCVCVGVLRMSLCMCVFVCLAAAVKSHGPYYRNLQILSCLVTMVIRNCSLGMFFVPISCPNPKSMFLS